MFRVAYLGCLILFCVTALSAQNLSGFWTGKLTQHTNGKVVDYVFSLSLKQTNGKVSGRSYVAIDEIFAEEALKGSFEGKKLYFQEIKILREKVIPNLEWCIKFGELDLKYKNGKAVLEGWWKGATSFGLCDDGEIFLEKNEDMASQFP